MTDIHVDTLQLRQFAATLDSAAATVGPRARTVVRHHGMLLQTRVKRHAGKPRSGPPGPRIITGDYNRSISLAMSGNAFFSQAEVGTNRPQGRRLELGFHGTDSLGRTYNQPPYEHFGPGLDETEPGFVDAIAAIADELLE